MKRVLRRLYFYYFYSISVLTYLLLFPMAYCLLLNKKTYTAMHSLRRFWARMVLFLTFIRCDVTKEFQPEKDKTYIYCGNHFSNLDIIVCLAYLPSYFGFLGKTELKSLPGIQLFFRTIDIDVNRKNAAQSAMSYKKSVMALKEGKSLVIFPEGGIIGEPRLHPFKDGPFDLGIRTKTEIIPFAMPDNYKLLPDGINEAKAGKIRLILHKAFETSHLKKEDNEKLRDEVFKVINTSLSN
ncbi:MAG: lysophospholipid acyltransferase family protein [Bacteroidetes bacterium]|nr:lysophospholipid acyltransferase family protein [Bacteroidota bacterium]